MPLNKVNPGSNRWGPEDKNPRWNGGRYLTTEGYVMVKVPDGHHLAMKGKPYAYEHRLVAEKKLGRRLKKGEIVHHRDENRQHNEEENILVTGSIGKHKVHHRSKGSALRLPGEPNPIISCGCGCGSEFPKYDESGRPRRFLPGGHWRKGKKGGWKSAVE